MAGVEPQCATEFVCRVSQLRGEHVINTQVVLGIRLKSFVTGGFFESAAKLQLGLFQSAALEQNNALALEDGKARPLAFEGTLDMLERDVGGCAVLMDIRR